MATDIRTLADRDPGAEGPAALFWSSSYQEIHAVSMIRLGDDLLSVHYDLAGLICAVFDLAPSSHETWLAEGWS